MELLAVRCGCGNVWAAEARHQTSRCTRCGLRLDLRKAIVRWRGNSATEARAVVAALRQQHLEDHAPAWARPHSSSSETRPPAA